MLKIKNFNHDAENQVITFEVERNGVTKEVKTEATDFGASYTDIGIFTEDWTDAEYSQLEDFLRACSGVVHQFYHDAFEDDE